MALTKEQITNLLTIRISMRMRELIDFSLVYPGTWEEMKGEFEFLQKRLEELQ